MVRDGITHCPLKGVRHFIRPDYAESGEAEGRTDLTL
jgi:hypothetical protein